MTILLAFLVGLGVGLFCTRQRKPVRIYWCAHSKGRSL